MKKHNFGEICTMYSDEVSGINKPSAIKSFEEAGLWPILVENVTKYGFKQPTPVQKNVIPAVMASRDMMVACAQTDSGKTAAFLIPIIHRLIEADAGSGGDGPQCIVVTSARQSAIQIHNEACIFAPGSTVRSVVACEGTTVRPKRLLRGCNLLVATLDSLLDLVMEGSVSLSNCKYLVVDEADRMWEVDFMLDIQELVEEFNMPKKAPKGERQTLIFGASLPDEIQERAQEFLAEDYLFISVGVR